MILLDLTVSIVGANSFALAQDMCSFLKANEFAPTILQN